VRRRRTRPDWGRMWQSRRRCSWSSSLGMRYWVAGAESRAAGSVAWCAGKPSGRSGTIQPCVILNGFQRSGRRDGQ
jgi:hypothetical protein